jgi:hypothetical protein
MFSATYVLMPINSFSTSLTLEDVHGVPFGFGYKGSTNTVLGLKASSNSLILFFSLIFSNSRFVIKWERASPVVKCNLRIL